MNPLTHRIIAMEVGQRLKEELKINLLQNSLIWGSVRPDFVKHSLSHYKDEQIGLFYAKYNQLCTLDFEHQTKEFCIELGEIFHFLCDYFCFAHNESFLKKEMWPHLKYENGLQKYAKKAAVTFQVNYADYSMVPLKELLEYKHTMYLNTLPSYENDLYSSFEICMIVANRFFNIKKASSLLRLNAFFYPFIPSMPGIFTSGIQMIWPG